MKKSSKDFNNNGQTEVELDFTQADAVNYWCSKYGKTQRKTTSGGSTTIKYYGVPSNQGKAFKFKIETVKPYMRTSGLASGETEGLYHKTRLVHVDSVGKVWWVENEVEEQIFQTTLHEGT